MYYEEFIPVADMYWRANPGQRQGQAYFNALYRFRSDLANGVRAGSYDPFYNDDRIPAFLEYLKENWS